MPKARRTALFRRISRKMKTKPELLTVIGNGFDLHHELKSSYWDFRDFISDRDQDLLNILEHSLDTNPLWSDFEGSLGDIDVLIERAEMFLVSYGSEDWSDSYHHDYGYELDKGISAITGQLKDLFTEWILSLNLTIKKDVGDKRLNIRKHSIFLNFNYTPTLEKVYGIQQKSILYLHHKAIDKKSLLILGHSMKPRQQQPLTAYRLEETQSEDPRVLEGERTIEEYYKNTYKSTDKVISDNFKFFKSLRNVSEVHILGHSLSSVDLEYFRIIFESTKHNNVKWKVSYQQVEDILHHRKALMRIGVGERSITFYRLMDVYSKQYSLF